MSFTTGSRSLSPAGSIYRGSTLRPRAISTSTSWNGKCFTPRLPWSIITSALISRRTCASSIIARHPSSSTGSQSGWAISGRRPTSWEDSVFKMKGLILSGGKGTRLRPLTFTQAKQLVPVANKPVLFYGITALIGAGIRDTGIIGGDTRTEIREAVGDGARWGKDVRIAYIEQPEPLGLAHAVLVAEDFLGREPFVMYLGDNILKSGIVSLADSFRQRKPHT